jgi:hypothetical protein
VLAAKLGDGELVTNTSIVFIHNAGRVFASLRAVFAGSIMSSPVCSGLAATLRIDGSDARSAPFGVALGPIDVASPTVSAWNATFHVITFGFANQGDHDISIQLALDAETLGEKTSSIEKVDGGVRFAFDKGERENGHFVLVGCEEAGQRSRPATRWVGRAPQRFQNSFAESHGATFEGQGGGFAVSWDVKVAAGESVNVRVGFGLAAGPVGVVRPLAQVIALMILFPTVFAILPLGLVSGWLWARRKARRAARQPWAGGEGTAAPAYDSGVTIDDAQEHEPTPAARLPIA